MDHTLTFEDPPMEGSRLDIGRGRVVCSEIGIGRRQVTIGTKVETLPIKGIQNTERRATEAYSLFEHRVKHRREVAGRRVDDLQYLCDRLLLLQRLACFCDQSRVLDGDDCLVGKSAEQRELLLGEWFHPVADHDEDPDRLVLV